MLRTIYSTFLFFILLCLKWWELPAKTRIWSLHVKSALSDLIVNTLINQEPSITDIKPGEAVASK